MHLITCDVSTCDVSPFHWRLFAKNFALFTPYQGHRKTIFRGGKFKEKEALFFKKASKFLIRFLRNHYIIPYRNGFQRKTLVILKKVVTSNQPIDLYFCPKFKVQTKTKIKVFTFNRSNILVEFPNASVSAHLYPPFLKRRGQFERSNCPLFPHFRRPCAIQ